MPRFHPWCTVLSVMCLVESGSARTCRNKASSYRLCELGRPTLKGGLCPLRASCFNSAARRSLSCAASSSAVVVVLGLFGRPKSDRSRCKHHRWTPNTKHGQKQILSLNRSRMMQHHQILRTSEKTSATKRKSDQPEETTVNEPRVDDIATDQGGRLRLLQYASATSMR